MGDDEFFFLTFLLLFIVINRNDYFYIMASEKENDQSIKEGEKHKFADGSDTSLCFAYTVPGGCLLTTLSFTKNEDGYSASVNCADETHECCNHNTKARCGFCRNEIGHRSWNSTNILRIPRFFFSCHEHTTPLKHLLHMNNSLNLIDICIRYICKNFTQEKVMIYSNFVLITR